MIVSNILAEIRQATEADIRPLLTEFIRESLVDFLELDDIEEVIPSQSFADLGTDSMQATEFKLFLEKQLDCKLKTTVLLDYPTTDLLVEFLATEVLEVEQETVATASDENPDQADLLAIVALTGTYPGADNIEALWDNVVSGKRMVFEEVPGANGYGYGRINSPKSEDVLEFLKFSKREYAQLNRQEKIAYQTITNGLKGAGMGLKDLTGRTTGVYMGVSDYRDEDQEHLPSDVPLPNKVAFHLNLLGPSHVTNAFCSSVYVALHQALVAIERGECEQALVGGFNTIAEKEFKRLANHEFCKFFLSKDNCVRSFGDHATGFARSEGAGILLIKPLKQALKDKNEVHAVIRGSAVYHGGRGFNFNAPNARGIKKAVWESLKKAGLSADDIDYIEAHGIGNSMADVAEIGAIEDAYVAASEKNDKTWQTSSIKPTTGHPEYAAGFASLIKAVQAIRHQTIPGIPGLEAVNPEITEDSRLVLQREHKPWKRQASPRRVALCSYAIGGVNAQIILEEYRPDALPKSGKKSTNNLAINNVLASQSSTPTQETSAPMIDLVKEVLDLDMNKLDLHQPIMNYGFDSIKVMQLVRRANEKLGTKIKMGQVMRVNTFQEFLELYQPKLQLDQAQPVEQTPIVFTDLVKEILGLDVREIDPNDSILSYGFDSIKVMQLVRRANEKLGTRVKMGQVMRVNTFQEFLSLFEQNRGVQNTVAQVALPDQLPDLSLEGKTYPISEMQKGMWFIQKMEADSTRLNVPIYFHCQEKVDTATLWAAFEALLENNPILRTSFRLNNAGDITHTIHPTRDCLNLELMTLEEGQDLLTLGKSLLRHPFELDKPPLVRLFLMTNPHTGEHHVLFIVHHIVIDGMSGVWLMQEYWKAYYQIKKGDKVDTSNPDTAYFDFVKWEQKYVESQEGLQDRQWWVNQLQNMPKGINLPYDEVKPHEDAIGSGCEKFYIRGTQLEQLKQLAADRRVNFSTMLLAIFKVFIHKISQQDNLAVITPVQGRPSENYEDSMGCYINIIVTNTQVAPHQPFQNYLEQVRDKFIDGLDYLFYPFAKVVEGLGLNLSRRVEEARLNPLSISYTYQNIFDGWLALEDEIQKIEPNYDIFQEAGDNYGLEVYDWRDHLQLNFKYKKSLFYAATIQHHLQYFGQLLNEIISQPAQLIGKFPALPTRVRNVEYPVLPDTSADYPKDECIHNLFKANVEKNPEQLAVVGADGQLTYQELDALSGQLAHQLVTAGATPDSLVGVCLPRSLDMIVAVMGIIKAGAAYVPLDAAHPDERLNYMLENADLKLLVTCSHLEERLKQVAAVQNSQLFFTDRLEKGTGTSVEHAHQVVAADGLAYMIYTSGSTGKPKGVMVTHQGVINHSFSTIRQFGFTPEDRLLQFASISFDVFAEDVFPTLIAGATLVMMEDEKFIDPMYVKQTMQLHKVTLVNFPTAYWHTLSSMSFQDTTLRTVLIGGEQAEMEHYKQWRENNPNLPVMNTYGPTETTISVAYYPMTEATTKLPNIPIGQPYQNTQLYVLNEQLEQLPVGEIGELYIAGDGVTRGYWKNEALTQEKFVDNPFNPGTRLYKSGDKAQWNAEGQLVCLGRVDQQVKIRGFRVELGEIEQVLSAHPLVLQAVVVAQKINQNQQLKAFVTFKVQVKAEALSVHLKERLPEYMIPANFELVDKFPLTVNGKVDRKKLSETKNILANSATTQVASEGTLDEVAQELIALWQSKLGVAQVGVDDNFFEIGGHSLLGVQLVHLMNQRWKGSNLQVLDLMKNPTIRGVVQKIRESGVLDTTTAAQKNNRGNSPYLITLRPSIPTFIVPGMPGLSDSYLELAESLATDGPVYGLQMKGFVQGEAAQTVQEMASHNIECIRQIHPQGKINLYAHSYGGTVLYEMLRQLQETALEVNNIVLMDCGLLPSQEEKSQVPLSKEMVSRFCKVMLSNAGINDSTVLTQVDAILENNLSESWKSKMVALFVQLKVGGDAAFLTKMWEVVETSLAVDYAYDAPKWDYVIKFVIAEESVAWLDANTWDDYYKNVEVIKAQGGHHTMLNKENCLSWL
ncbi:non-ribosomal peptide synthetase [Microscilla marina]|uniref:Mixed type I polyketide synthase-peptide synthetase, putative n=1 Tax=Microscilla marina ATCC 23134 TaxID=313606 RepID=A1ZSC1_MICM2|nr:non-ribosomal peptide synthetase [Microscilla marina]EAY26669.1 mixed type I polyketide synthase - peptide synthetase, putative [Microscilla marina ATCC 23134]